jgi:hypothetical protein
VGKEEEKKKKMTMVIRKRRKYFRKLTPTLYMDFINSVVIRKMREIKKYAI